jgi:beta-alanine degradation protein BauB
MPAPRPQAVPTQMIQNDLTVTTEWRFAPGAETGWHRHGMDYVVVPMTTGTLLLEEPGGGTREAQLTAGQPYFKSEGVEHNVVNANAYEFVFIEIELKKQA